MRARSLDTWCRSPAGLWGEGTAFATFTEFYSALDEGGVGKFKQWKDIVPEYKFDPTAQYTSTTCCSTTMTLGGAFAQDRNTIWGSPGNGSVMVFRNSGRLR